MTRFIVYLFETGLCLSLLYWAYWLFLRKETYFNFNRGFLVGSIVLAISVPLLHLNFSIRQGGSMEDPAIGIVKFRNYYEELIAMTDADFGTEPRAGKRVAGVRNGGNNAGQKVGSEGVGQEGSHGSFPSVADSRPWMSPARGFIIIYLVGVMYFFGRFIYLLIRLYLLAFRNRVTRMEEFRMVEIKEDISPFSFFRFLFINNESFDESEFRNVLEHERAHIIHKHSMV